MSSRVVCVGIVLAGLAAASARSQVTETAPPPETAEAETLPVDAAALVELAEVRYSSVRNLLSLEQVRRAIGDGAGGLTLDLGHVTALLDGRAIDPTQVYGTVYVGPYPFEAAESRFAYKRFRRSSAIRGGRATIDVGSLLKGKYNSEGWTDRGTVVVRLELFLPKAGGHEPLGTYDTFTAFRKTGGGYEKLPWLAEGPLVNLITSDDPTRALVRFQTDEEVKAAVVLDDGRRLASGPAREHAVELVGLEAGRTYGYRVEVGPMSTRTYRLRAAPPPGAGPVRFAYCGDSREGVGGGMQTFMGVNHRTLTMLAAQAYARGAEFWLMGGDLINGYTTVPEDFQTQLAAWKQAMSGFWAERALYPGIGNHETLLRNYQALAGVVRVDRWPYATESAEAVFAAAFDNPTNGPEPSDPRRPSYRENVFSFQYGLVRIIAFNNNYWYSSAPSGFGGAPEGYIFDDQLAWIEAELRKAEEDPTVRYVVLYAQEPVFPCGGHLSDAMWYDGSAGVRAYAFRDGKLRPEPRGILEVRNRLARAVAASGKVAAVLGGDEHGYYRGRIGKQVPVGDPGNDDANGDGRIDWQGGESASPLADFARPVWYVTCGGGGAPYYAEEPAPWNTYWKKQDEPAEGYYYSSQENVLIFHADGERIGVRAYNPYGELIDDVPDLMAR